MKVKDIAVVNGELIKMCTDDPQFVPIGPICKALGVDLDTQHEKIRENFLLTRVVDVKRFETKDGGLFDAVCLPVKYIFGWLSTIESDDLESEVLGDFKKYREECYNKIYNFVFLRPKQLAELFQAEIETLRDIDTIEDQLEWARKRLDSIRAREQELLKIDLSC